MVFSFQWTKEFLAGAKNIDVGAGAKNFRCLEPEPEFGSTALLLIVSQSLVTRLSGFQSWLNSLRVPSRPIHVY